MNKIERVNAAINLNASKVLPLEINTWIVFIWYIVRII
jgi:hypothetical protein